MRLTYRRNMGTRDRAVRFPAGMALLAAAAGLPLHPAWAALSAVAGFGILESAATGY
ncbi:MAG: YgaP-like transmembrane domain [Desulfotomaculales bacterium]